MDKSDDSKLDNDQISSVRVKDRNKIRYFYDEQYEGSMKISHVFRTNNTSTAEIMN